MKRTFLKLFILGFGLSVLTLVSCGKSESKPEEHDMNMEQTEMKQEETMSSTVQYTCPMHPEVLQDTPGQCPVCKMDLVEKE